MSFETDEIREKLDEFMGLFEELKSFVKSNNKILYERWKAGGFIVDSNILSMYPAIEKVVETIIENKEEMEDIEEEDIEEEEE